MSSGTRCAVVGTGDMGLALAAALLGGGHEVTVWNRTAERYAALLDQGAKPADSVAAAVAAAELVIVCLLDDATTRQVLSAEEVGEALAGRTLLQFSFSNGYEAAALERWVREQGGDYLHGQIKAYPREIGSSDVRLNYSGAESTFQRFRSTVERFGSPFYLGSDIHAACVVSNISTVLYGCFVGAFFEAAAYAAAEGAQLESLVPMLPSAIRLLETTVGYSAEQLASGDLTGDQATIDTHANALGTCLRAMRSEGRPAPQLAQAALDYLEQAQAKDLGSLEIAAVYKMLTDSLDVPART